jgi:hypothetical protein
LLFPILPVCGSLVAVGFNLHLGTESTSSSGSPDHTASKHIDCEPVAAAMTDVCTKEDAVSWPGH